jgi:general secretion pathway protein N
MARPPRRDATARGEPGVARKFGLLAAVGFAAVACFAIATLPARLIAGTLQRFGLSATEFSGTIWSGTATDVTWRGTSLGELRWRLRPLALLRARAAADLTLARSDGSASATAAAALGGTLELSAVRVDLPLDLLSQLQNGLPRGWHGRASGTFDEIRLVAGWPVTAHGTLDLVGLVAPQLSQSSIGNFQLVAPDPRATSAGPPGVAARVSDRDGALSVDAVLTLAAGRSFLLEGTVAPRDSAPPGLVRSLEFLGPADASGRRPFGVSGTL